jgi:hypothetical protein
MTASGAAANGEDGALSTLLCDVLRLAPQPSGGAGLGERIAALGWDRLLAHAEGERLTSVLVRAIERQELAPSVPPLTLPDGRMTIPKALAEHQARHLDRRRVMAERLGEIATALNAAGMVPLVLKGGRSLVTGTPDWRHLRDIDLLVAGEDAPRAQRIVHSLGYQPLEAPRGPLMHHHLHSLFRRDMPGWIEVHRQAGASRVEHFFPTRELAAAAVTATAPGGAEVRILPPPLQVLYGVMHHHIGHRAPTLAELPLKGLYEFAAELTALTDEECRLLAERAARHPRVLAILDLWTVAAADMFGMPVLPPLTRAADAVAWWSSMRVAPVPGIERELRASTSAERMRRARRGHSRLRRLLWRVSTPLTFIKWPLRPLFLRD